ncbi:MBOAT, membrane-bound O-acyltransferase family-domain-containing protein [Choanephora cucurbitarum]|nr:MBOAT, membrane-bound O-acyltransferase family-domain-containing protein [Choanephora cucurbitarum]
MEDKRWITLRKTKTKRLTITLEFYFYYVCIASVVPYMLYTTHQLSQEVHPNYYLYSNLLSEGWLWGRKVDNSDMQYAQFRNHLAHLTALVSLWLCIRYLYRLLPNQTITSHVWFNLVCSMCVLLGLHGTGFIKIYLIVTTSYLIGKATGGSILNPLLTWSFNLAVLFLNEQYHGYTFGSIGLGYLDPLTGLLPRWHVLFNFSMLRLVSYNMDAYWYMKSKRHYVGLEEPSMRERIEMPYAPSIYHYSAFLSYIFYAPLYLCGPIVTFNNYMSQLQTPISITRPYLIQYAIRLLSTLFVMEIVLHSLYVVAISKAQAWHQDSPFELSMIGYFNLLIIWMKLLIPWRFFRLWALLDGIWPEENMIRCMSNNFSAQRFWKSWHRSFNRWTVRYIYIPLGGSSYLGFSIWVVFTFVAIWHDIELRLLAWGWLICLFLLPEIIGSRLFSLKKYGHRWYYRFVCGIGCVFNILMMMVANLVGFCLGLDGMKTMLSDMFHSINGYLFLLTTVVCLFVAVQIMFEIRESEKRRGDFKWTM